MVIRTQAEAIELLEQENRTLNDQIDRELIKRARLEDRIKKAIDYIEYWCNDEFNKKNKVALYPAEIDGLLEILKGEE